MLTESTTTIDSTGATYLVDADDREERVPDDRSPVMDLETVLRDLVRAIESWSAVAEVPVPDAIRGAVDTAHDALCRIEREEIVKETTPSPSRISPTDEVLAGLAEEEAAQMTDQLADYEAYDFPNWDGDGAVAITPETLASARQFLEALTRQPDVAPGADGTIGFEWPFDEGPMRMLMVIFGDDGADVRAVRDERAH